VYAICSKDTEDKKTEGIELVHPPLQPCTNGQLYFTNLVNKYIESLFEALLNVMFKILKYAGIVRADIL
jgi:hypothetical protein